MTRRLLILLGLCLCLAACATTSGEEKRKQAEAFRSLGEAYMADGNHTLALRELLKAEQLYSEDHLLQDDLGLAYLSKGRFDSAIDHFKKSLAIKPDYSPAKNNLGSAYLAKGELDKAIAIFQDLTQDILYATPHFPLFNLGVAYFHKKDYVTAEKYFREALDVSPGFARARQWIGRTYIERGMLPAAIKELDRAVRMDPTNAPSYFDLARAYTLSGELGQALRYYQKVIEISPADSDLVRQARMAIEDIRGR